MASDETQNTTVAPIKDSTKSQNPNAKRAPRKIYVPIRIQTNALNNDDIAINATYISIEDFTSARKKKKKSRAKNFEIRYLESIRSLRDKIKSSYSCNQDQCPQIKERLDLHQMEHHNQNQVDCQMRNCVSRPLASYCSYHDCHSQTNFEPMDYYKVSKATSHGVASMETRLKTSVAISPAASILERDLTPRYMETHSMQTPPKFVDFNHPTPSAFGTKLLASDEQTQYYKDSGSKPMSVANGTDLSPKHSFLKNLLAIEIQNWLEDIPMSFRLTSSLKDLKTNMYNNFIDRVFELMNDADANNYEETVKAETDDFLNSLPMWCPGEKRDLDLQKENICNSLLERIEKLRTRNSETEAMRNVNDMENTDDNNMSENKNFDYALEKIVESQVLDWLMEIKFRESADIGRTLNIFKATEIFTKRLMPLLAKPSFDKSCKLKLKGLIVDTLNDLPNILHYPKHQIMFLNRIAEKLSNRLIKIQSKYRNSRNFSFPREKSTCQLTVCSKLNFKQTLQQEINECLHKVSIEQRGDVKEEITEILIDCLESISFKDDIESRNKLINNVFPNSAEISETQTSDIITESVKDFLKDDYMKNGGYNMNKTERSCHSGILSVFTSEHELTGKYPVSSTPKRTCSTKKEVSRLNKEEISYMDNVATVIKLWMETLPRKFDEAEGNNYKETIIKDLAGDIMDQVKLEQLAPQASSDRDKYMFYIIFRWLYKFDAVEDLNDANPYVEDLMQRLQGVLEPTLTKPQRGSRQAMANIKHMEGEKAWKENFVPTGLDVLQDEISIWLDEQPSAIYSKADKDSRHKMVNELAKTIQNYTKKGNSEQEIVNELSKWLKKMLQPSEKNNIAKLAENLKDRIIKLPQDATLAEHMQKKIEQREEVVPTHCNPCKCSQCETDNDQTNDPDRTLVEFIGKFMERNYEVDDSLARGAFGELLKTEFRKLTPPTRKEVYDNFSKSKQHEEFSPERLSKELQYIKDISDWLKNIPIDGSFNTPQNKQRIEFVNDLAKNIYEVEESRRKDPTALDYNMYLASIISQFTYLLPILPEHTGNVMLMIDQLIGKIVASRASMPCCQNAYETKTSLNSTSIPEQNINEFIDKYIHLNAGEIADDPVKLDAWSARILKEVKKIILDTADPSTLCKTQVYNKITNIPIPEEETVRLFGLELDYAKEISDWLNNLPLVTNSSPEATEQRVKMISDLAEKFAEKEKDKVIHPNEQTNEQPNTEMEEYIANWIHQLPLNSNKEIVMPLAIRPLQNRIEKVNKGSKDTVFPEDSTLQSTITPKKSKSKIKSKTKKSTSFSCGAKAKQSGQIVVDAIENWSKSLPVKAENKSTEKELKDNLARKLFQKIGELSVDPLIMNDDLLYQELLTDEVNLQLNSLPQNSDLEKKKENLKNDIVKKVMEAKSIVKEHAAGEKYKQQLENTIDASIPNPIVNKQWHDPGFEIYKNHLADMFILENCDHGSDSVKAKYEMGIQKEIDKYFQDALKRNAVPLSREQIYSELYGALFKVPMPSECSTAEEVERIKTRCELDEWFNNLPLQVASSAEEHLNRDKILSMLAKRLHEIELNESKPDEKIHKEIEKWLRKLPFLPGQESKIGKLTAELENKLKSTKEDRKWVPASPLKVKDSKTKDSRKLKNKGHKVKGVLGTSQVAGPSSEGKMWVSPPPAAQTCCQASAISRRKPVDIILEMVENWSANLPFYETTPKEQESNKIIRDDLVTKIIIKLSELNSDPRIFDDDLLYNYFFDKHLEKIMAKLPICCDFHQTKDAKKLELIEAVQSVKPLIKEDRARHEYKQELKTTVTSFLKEPLDTTADKIAMFHELRDEIVDNFLQYNYNIDDDEGKQIYKAKLREAVTRYFLEINENPDNPPADTLIRQNQLLCELAKIEIPSEKAVKDEVEEIRMKDEVKQFFDELPLPEGNDEKKVIINKMKLSLAKRLNEIEKTGHNCSNDAKMKKEIRRFLKKLDIEINEDKIQSFIDKLKATEAERKAPPASKLDNCYCPKDLNQTDNRPGPCSCGHSENNNQSVQNDMKNNLVINVIPPTDFSPNQETNNRQGSSMPCCPLDYNAKSLGLTPEYGGFGGGVALSSSPEPDDSKLQNPQHQNSQPQKEDIPPKCQRAPNSEGPTDNQEIKRRFEGNKRRRKQGTTSDEGTDEECNCLVGRRKFKGRPRCVLRRPPFCDDCDDFGPMWMPMAPYKYPPGYFYY